jgi:hypothetical protein
MIDEEFVPTLRPTTRLLFVDEHVEATGLLSSLHKSASPLKRVAEIAAELGHIVHESGLLSSTKTACPK